MINQLQSSSSVAITLFFIIVILKSVLFSSYKFIILLFRPLLSYNLLNITIFSRAILSSLRVTLSSIVIRDLITRFSCYEILSTVCSTSKGTSPSYSMFFLDFVSVFSYCFDFCFGFTLLGSNKAIFSLSN